MTTHSADIFFLQLARIREFLTAIATLAHSSVDDQQFRVDALVLLFIPDATERAAAQLRMEQRLETSLGDFLNLFCELVACRVIDAFELYLTDLAISIFLTVPATLLVNEDEKNKRTVELSSIINAFSEGLTLRDVINREAERKASNLAYKSLADRNKFWKNGQDFVLFESDDLNQVINMCEERNILVHNRGVVNSVFLQKTSNSNYPRPLAIGDQIEIDRERLFAILDLTDRLVKDIDGRAWSKWGLVTITND